LITKKKLPDDNFPDFIGNSVTMPGPDKGSWCNNSAACSLEATFNPRYPCSCSNGWPEENKTCQHYFPLNKYVPPEEASRHCLNCKTNVSDCITINAKERYEAIWQCQSCPRGKFGYQTKAISLWKGCQDCKKGTYSELVSVNKASICKGCPKGTWSDILGVIAEAQCQLCITGKYGQTSIGANASSSCSDCPKGKYLGTVGFFGIESCQSCPIGFAQANEGRAFCLPCTPGKYMNEDGKNICNKCLEGKSSTEVARVRSCDVCDTGLHQPNLGMTAVSILFLL